MDIWPRRLKLPATALDYSGQHDFSHMDIGDIFSMFNDIFGGAGGSRIVGLGKHFRRKSTARGLNQFLQLPGQHLANEFIVVPQPILRGNKNQLGRL